MAYRSSRGRSRAQGAARRAGGTRRRSNRRSGGGVARSRGQVLRIVVEQPMSSGSIVGVPGMAPVVANTPRKARF